MKPGIISETIRNSIKQYRFRSIFVKNFLIYVSSITLPIILLNILVFTLFSNQLGVEREKESSISLIRLSDNVISSFDESGDIAYMLNIDYYVQKFITTNNLSASELTKQTQHISNLMSAFANSNEYIDSIMLYSEKQNFVYSTRSSNYLSDYFDTSWYDDYLKNKGSLSTWRDYRKLRPIDTPMSSDIPVMTQFFIIQTDSLDYGLVAVNINPKAFVKNENLYDNEIFIFNSEENIYCSSDNTHYPQKLLKKVNSMTFMGTTQKITVSGKDFFVCKDAVHNLYFAFLPSQDAGTKNKMIVVAFLSITISLLIVLFMSVTVGKKSLQPIEKIMNLLKEQSASVHNSASLTSSETDYILDTVTRSFTLNQDLKAELSANLFSLQQYQIMALQSQINPHFLYNTLNTINLTAMELTGGENEASKMLEELSQLFRLAFSSGTYLISLKDEIEYLKKYINLQKIRWPNKFDVEFEIPGELEEYNVFKFSLQPIVENAISHGIKPLTSKGLIKISAKVENNLLKITVYDNGVGITKNNLAKININIEKENYAVSDAHIGLSNVNGRIKLLFGKKYGIEIDSEENKYTKVTYTLPLIKNP